MQPNQNENHDWNVNEQFSEDLKALFEPTAPVNAQTDRCVMDEAARRLRHRSKPKWKRYWPACAAAAAAIAAGILFLNDNRPKDVSAPIALKNDANRDGAVDILDAYKLAQQIGANAEIDPKWDTNGDGIVDQKDVDRVAMAAVSLKEGVL